MTLILAATLAIIGSAGEDSPVSRRIATGGPTVLALDWRGSRVVVTIHAADEDIKQIFGDSVAPGQFPERVRIIRRLTIAVDGKLLFVARSAYCDLVNVRIAELSIKNNSLILLIKGGDASESFRAEVEFDHDAVKRRALFSGELPSEPLQETVYHLRVIH